MTDVSGDAKLSCTVLVQPGAVKWSSDVMHWMHIHVTQVHPVMSENQFHCTRLYVDLHCSKLRRLHGSVQLGAVKLVL